MTEEGYTTSLQGLMVLPISSICILSLTRYTEAYYLLAKP
ncbi:hypothetical protein H1P_4200001 [Hyella patelloides LEGE 07179]|uniref:Uncharacterized protein n=1 Tax=Hyella patelloides LEGE 07179 TaxID=945734 RepID=A0A563VXU5_9CYAN|nr:hypothetical protein H1P_4200001 [Hyella patelloides LEGE 07179]